MGPNGLSVGNPSNKLHTHTLYIDGILLQNILNPCSIKIDDGTAAQAEAHQGLARSGAWDRT